MLNEFFKQPKLCPSEPGGVVCSKHKGGCNEPKPKNLLGSRSCLVDVMKRSFTNHCIPNADGFVGYIIWKPPKQPKWNTGYFWRKELAKEEVGVYIYVVRMLCKIFPTIRSHISMYFDSFVWNTLVYCYLKSLFASLGYAFYGFLIGYFMLLEYKRKVKFPDISGQAKQKIQSKTIVMLTATTKAKA